jgi:hypothetical protein
MMKSAEVSSIMVSKHGVNPLLRSQERPHFQMFHLQYANKTHFALRVQELQKSGKLMEIYVTFSPENPQLSVG